MAKSKPKPKPKPKPRDYIMGSSGKPVCFESNVSKCTVKAKLWEAGVSNPHDAVLQAATREINEIIEQLDRGNSDRSRHLSFIQVEGQRMLVWMSHGEPMASDDDDIAKALKITGRATRGEGHHG